MTFIPSTKTLATHVSFLLLALLVAVCYADPILWVTTAGHSAAHQMSAVASAWLSTHPHHTMTFLAYDENSQIIQTKHKDIQVESFGVDTPFDRKDRDEAARLMQENNIDGIAYLLGKVSEPYEEEVKATERVVRKTKPTMAVVDVFATSAMDYLTANKIPYVVFYHCIALGVFGIGDSSWALPDALTGTNLSQRSLWDRFVRVLNFLRIVIKTSGVTEKLNAARSRLGFATYNAPDTNIVGHPIIVPSVVGFEYSRPLSPLFHLVGFIADKKADSPEKFEAITNDEKSLVDWIQQTGQPPVVYAAFGTEVTLSPDFITKLIQGTVNSNSRLLLAARPHALAAGGVDDLSQLVTFLNVPENMFRHVEWTKQPMVLAQDAVKVFVTHGGASSVAEGVYAHVPMLVIPSGGDRGATAARLVDQVGCVRIDLLTFDASDLTAEIEYLFENNERIVERLKWLERVNEHAGGGSREAARQLEHILQDGYEHLIPVSSQLSILAANSYDLILIAIAIFHLLGFTFYKVVSHCCVRRTRTGKQKTE